MDLGSIKEKLAEIREARELSAPRQRVLYSAGFFVFGILLGIFSKWLDDLAIDDSVWWQRIIGILGLGTVFTELAVWLVIALAIAVYSRTPMRAGINVFLFFGGMCASYHIWTLLFSGFDPGRYMLIWYGITVLSPLFAAVCWYGKGASVPSIAIDSLILAVLATQCFSVGPVYFYFCGVINTLLFAAAAVILYKSPKQICVSLACGIVLSVLAASVLPIGR